MKTPPALTSLPPNSISSRVCNSLTVRFGPAAPFSLGVAELRVFEVPRNDSPWVSFEPGGSRPAVRWCI